MSINYDWINKKKRRRRRKDIYSNRYAQYTKDVCYLMKRLLLMKYSNDEDSIDDMNLVLLD